MSALPPVPALVTGHIHHVRHRPLRHAFRHRHFQWLIDLDHPPVLPRWARPLAGFRGEDHLAGARGIPALKANVLRILARHGLPSDSVERVLMLAHPRTLGHVFNPMTAFWCVDADEEIVGIVVEVHNTYAGRHAYVLRPDGRGRAEVAKDFAVSPFNDVDGTYEITSTLRPDRVSVAIRLVVEGRDLVNAVVTGRPRPATPSALLRATLTHLPMTYRVTGLIRLHGIWLWLRRLPVRPRPLPNLESVR